MSAQHIDANGLITWDPAGITVTPLRWQNDPDYAIATDGNGGAIFIGANPNINTVPGTWTVTTQHLSSSGQNTWGSSGIALTDEHNPVLAPAAAEDGSGGAFVAWQSCDVQGPNCQIKAHHLSATGTLPWPSLVQVTTILGGKNGPQLLSDGSGGVAAFWSDCRNGTPSTCGGVQDIYAQRISATGQILWQANGNAISAAAGNQGLTYAGGISGIALTGDTQGGAILAWPDGRNHQCSLTPVSRCDLFAQRIHY